MGRFLEEVKDSGKDSVFSPVSLTCKWGCPAQMSTAGCDWTEPINLTLFIIAIPSEIRVISQQFDPMKVLMVLLKIGSLLLHKFSSPSQVSYVVVRPTDAECMLDEVVDQCCQGEMPIKNFFHMARFKDPTRKIRFPLSKIIAR